MVTSNDVKQCIDHRLRNILNAAEMGLEAQKFEVFRKIVMAELGFNGLASDFAELLNGKVRNGKERQGPDDAGRKGGAL